MKRIFIPLAIVLIISFTANGQIIDEIPIDENGKINFNDVVKVDSVSSKELYVRAKQFFVNIFKSANDVVQMDDKESGIIVGKGFNDIYIKILANPVAIQMWYSIKIQCKDGRYKYEIYDINFKSYSSQYAASSSSPAEPTFDKKTYYKKNGEPRDVNEKYKIEMTKSVESLVNSIKTEMNKPGTLNSKNGDW